MDSSSGLPVYQSYSGSSPYQSMAYAALPQQQQYIPISRKTHLICDVLYASDFLLLISVFLIYCMLLSYYIFVPYFLIWRIKVTRLGRQEIIIRVCIWTSVLHI